MSAINLALGNSPSHNDMQQDIHAKHGQHDLDDRILPVYDHAPEAKPDHGNYGNLRPRRSVADRNNALRDRILMQANRIADK